jgi:hypothetical protein
MITQLETIDKLLQEKNLLKLEDEFYRRYRGLVPDLPTYNKAFDDYLRFADSVKLRCSDTEKSYVQTSAYRRSRQAQMKCLLIDAIITLRKEMRYHHKDQVHSSRFCSIQQLINLN